MSIFYCFVHDQLEDHDSVGYNVVLTDTDVIVCCDEGMFDLEELELEGETD